MERRVEGGRERGGTSGVPGMGMSQHQGVVLSENHSVPGYHVQHTGSEGLQAGMEVSQRHSSSSAIGSASLALPLLEGADEGEGNINSNSSNNRTASNAVSIQASGASRASQPQHAMSASMDAHAAPDPISLLTGPRAFGPVNPTSPSSPLQLRIASSFRPSERGSTSSAGGFAPQEGHPPSLTQGLERGVTDMHVDEIGGQ